MNPVIASRILAPTSTEDSNSSDYTRFPERLAGTGTTEAHSRTDLAENKMASIMVGNSAVRVTWRSARGVASAVATTDLILPAASCFTWVVDPLTKYVYVEAADGAAIYECWVWRSST